MGALYLTIKLDYVGKTTEDGKVLKDSTDLVFYLIEKSRSNFSSIFSIWKF